MAKTVLDTLFLPLFIEKMVNFTRNYKLILSFHTKVEIHERFKTNSAPNVAPVVVRNDSKKMLDRLSKVMTRKVNIAVNNTMEKVFKDFMK